MLLFVPGATSRTHGPSLLGACRFFNRYEMDRTSSGLHKPLQQSSAMTNRNNLACAVSRVRSGRAGVAGVVRVAKPGRFAARIGGSGCAGTNSAAGLTRPPPSIPATASGTRRQTSPGPNGGDRRCLRSGLQTRSARTTAQASGPARSADDAIDRLLLDFLAMTPSDATSASRHRRRYQAALRQRWPTDVELAWLRVRPVRHGLRSRRGTTTPVER